MNGTWPHPSFTGAFLPDRYDINEQSFDAEWSVHAFARGLPEAWVHETREFDLDHQLGTVRLHNPVTPMSCP